MCLFLLSPLWFSRGNIIGSIAGTLYICINQQFVHETGSEKKSRSINSVVLHGSSFRVFLDTSETLLEYQEHKNKENA